jgi:citrate lyase subunit beta/citryl-CoA lyase
VPKADKERARQAAARITAELPPKPTYVRVNSMRSGLCEDDVRAVAGAGLTGVRIAKVEYANEVKRVEALLAEAGSPAVLHLLLETAHALEIAFILATASPAVGMLGIGESDLQADLRAEADGVTMDSSRARVIIASRAAGLPNPCQSVYTEVRDLDGLLRTSRHGKRLGFMGRMAIHPAQVPVIHEVYTPTKQEIEDAREICREADLARQQNKAIVLTERGTLIGPPIIANAQNVLRLANALEAVEASA